MSNSTLTIYDVTIHPGEAANLALPLPELYSCTSFYMPIKVVHGKEKGPCILLFAAVEGNELNGMEIINRLLQSNHLNKLKGTLIAIPVLNVFGLVNYPKKLPQEHSIEHCFPGREDGSYGERIAYALTKEILSKTTHCIELQTGRLNHSILPQLYCCFESKLDRTLAKAFQAPVITNVNKETSSLRQTTDKLKIPLIVYQAGEAMRFDESAIQLGLTGILNVMSYLDMINEYHFELSTNFNPVFSQDEDWLRASRGGVLHADIKLGQMIKKGQIIGRIVDPFSADIAQPVRAIDDGIVVGINNHPLISEGQSIFKVTSFIDNKSAKFLLKTWGEAQPDF
jgi:uncharacterized protein